MFEITNFQGGRGDQLYAQYLLNQASQNHQEALNLYPTNQKKISNLSDSLFKERKLSEAITMYQKSFVPNSQNIEFLCNEGDGLLQMGEYERAVSCYSKALNFDNNNLNSLFGKASALKQLGQYDEALLMYDKCLMINPLSTQAFLGKGKMALQSVEKALGLAPFNNQAILLKKFYQASLWCKRLLKNNPGDIKALAILMRALDFMQCKRETLTVSQFTKSYDPNLPIISLAELWFREL